jgi:trigger factor
MLVPELDKELEGKRKGDILKITATLPERFGERAGWQVGMQILVKDVKARKLPPLDDDFAKTCSEFDTLDELRADIREKVSEMKESHAEAHLREHVLDAFVTEAVDVDLPGGMVNLEIDSILTSFARVLAAQGVTLERYMEMEKIDAEALRQRFSEQAERNLKLRLGLDAVAEAEGLDVTDEDRETELKRLAERSQTTPDEVRRVVDERGDWKSIDGDILRSKALDLLVQRADITIAEDEDK